MPSKPKILYGVDIKKIIKHINNKIKDIRKFTFMFEETKESTFSKDLKNPRVTKLLKNTI